MKLAETLGVLQNPRHRREDEEAYALRRSHRMRAMSIRVFGSLHQTGALEAQLVAAMNWLTR